jgi:hypothetical protein
VAADCLTGSRKAASSPRKVRLYSAPSEAVSCRALLAPATFIVCVRSTDPLTPLRGADAAGLKLLSEEGRGFESVRSGTGKRNGKGISLALT